MKEGLSRAHSSELGYSSSFFPRNLVIAFQPLPGLLNPVRKEVIDRSEEKTEAEEKGEIPLKGKTLRDYQIKKGKVLFRPHFQ